MSSVDGIASVFVETSASRALAPVHSSANAQAQDSSRRQAPAEQAKLPAVVEPGARQRLEIQAQLLHQSSTNQHHLGTRARHAVNAYRALAQSDERDRLSAMLGIDDTA